MKARQICGALKRMHWQTKFFIANLLLYMIALGWTTIQSYVRLAYNRSDIVEPIIIKIPNSE